jgi:prepilin-type N-terminal cleavage/methylation domain-containing protein/prepilin-type processing-associated H-X9-DG protein
MQRSVARRSTRASRGFTLVELLVVITIIGILMGLLLPAVNSAREAARNNTCQNNLHQMGLAALAHEQANGYFPTGGWGDTWVGDPDAGFGINQPGGWVYNILPYMDAKNLHDQGLGQTQPNKTSAAGMMISTPVALFYCPSRRKGDAFVCSKTFKTGTGAGSVTSASVGRSDYAANGGVTTLVRFDGPTASPPPAQTNWPNVSPPGPATASGGTNASSGVCYVRSQIKVAHITDGPSNTFLFGEKFLNPDHYSDGSTASESPMGDPGDSHCALTGWANDLYRTCYWTNTMTATNNYAPRQDTPPPSGATTFTFNSNMIFGSPHPAGCNFVFCDGSIHSISFSIDPLTYSLLANRADNQAIDDSKWR